MSFVSVLKNLKNKVDTRVRLNKQIADTQMHKEKLEELIQVEIQKRLQSLKANQRSDLKALQELHLEGLRAFNQEWDERITELKVQGLALENSMKEKHRLECENFKKNFESSSIQPKQTSELLNLIEMRKKMIKTKRYVEADVAGEKIEELKLKLQVDWNKAQKMKYNAQFVNLTTRQATELESLRIRIRNGAEEKEKTRKKELEQLLQKYQNIILERENKHSFDLQKYEKILKKRKDSNYNIENGMIIGESNTIKI